MAVSPAPLKVETPPWPLAGQGQWYLPELDGLRFLAFFLVYLFHHGIPKPTRWRSHTVELAFADNGWVGVQLFFVLSGFLITTLLLREEAAYGRIDLRAFWVRRILRIWPLYYLIVFVAFLVLPAIGGDFRPGVKHSWLGLHLPAFLVFLGNWTMALVRPPPYDAQSVLWSVCLEEQFYLLCPLFLVWTAHRFRVMAALAGIGLAVAVRSWLAGRNLPQLAIQFHGLAQLDTLLAGVLLALLMDRWPPGDRADRWAGWLQWPLFAALLWILTRPGLAHGTASRRTWDFVAIWLGCAGVVALVVVRRGWLKRALSNPRLVWLGKISYGLYMYHEVALWLKRRIDPELPRFLNKDTLLGLAALGLTIGLAAASYYGFERLFLRRKAGWTRLPSRPV